MPKQFDPRHAATAFDHDSTLVVALELSGKSWEVGAAVPGLERRPRRRLAVRDMAGLLSSIDRWKAEAAKASRMTRRVVLTYEAGRDGFWIARYLLAQGIEVHVMHPASIPVDRRGRRAKTDRIDLDMLLRTFLAWLRGEPRVCSMARIPSEREEDLRRPGRERERLVHERLQLENRMENLLCLHGVSGFKPRLKAAMDRLAQLHSFGGGPLPDKTMAELKRLMARHQLIGSQLRALESERNPSAEADEPDEAGRKIQHLTRIVSLGQETATLLAYELFCRPFRDRRALASFVGLTGTPFKSGGMDHEQGIGKNGSGRIRRMLMQLAWRWLRFQPDSALSQWFAARTAGAKGRIRKVMIVALARKLLIALWRYVETGEVPAGARLQQA
jgi:transposase